MTKENDHGAKLAAVEGAGSSASPRDVREWCPSDKRVRCSNCGYLHRHNDEEAQCYNEDGPVAMWMFLATSEPSECWCEAFKPNDWLSKQLEMKELRKVGCETDSTQQASADSRAQRHDSVRERIIQAAEQYSPGFVDLTQPALASAREAIRIAKEKIKSLSDARPDGLYEAGYDAGVAHANQRLDDLLAELSDGHHKDHGAARTAQSNLGLEIA